MSSLLFPAGLILSFALLLAFIFVVRKISFKNLISRSLKLRLLLIRLPQNPDSERKTEEEINLSAQLFSILSGLKSPFVFEAAVANNTELINFYLAVSEKVIEFVKKQIQGLWPNSQVELASDYTIFNEEGVASSAYLKQKKDYVLPIRTFAEANGDTFLPILSNFTKFAAMGEGAVMQVVVQLAPPSVKKNISSILNKLKQGVSLENALKGKKLTSLKTGEPKKEELASRVIDEEAVKLLTNKVSKPIFSVNVRLLASAATVAQSEEFLESIAGSFQQFSAPSHNEFKIIRPHNPKNLIFKYVFREFDNGQSMTLGLDELVSVFHLPNINTAIPKINWIKSREAFPPVNLPEKGVLIGNSLFRGESRGVRITDEDRRRHVYVVGQTGTGKSVLLVNMSMEDINQGKGVAIIDPHGDLIDSVLGLIPENRKRDVIIFDPGDVARPLGLNMLEYNANRPEEKTFIVNEMQSIFNKLFVAETMGPMFEQYMRNALLLLMEDFTNPSTLIEVPRVFTDSEFRNEKLAKAANPSVVDFWEKEAVKAGGEAALANITPYITSKFNNFIANDYVRPIIGQLRSAFNFRDAMDEGKILLVNLSKGRIGDINAGLLGMIIVGRLLMAAFSRIDLPQEKRKDFNLYIDEFQNFTTDSIATILSEARKYRLNLVIAHQFIGQLGDKIRDAVFGNVGSMVVFRIGADDAEYLVKQFEPVFSKNDLINIDNFNAYVKLLINGQTTLPFNVRALPPVSGDEQKKLALKEHSRQVYGQDKKEIEAEILKRLRS